MHSGVEVGVAVLLHPIEWHEVTTANTRCQRRRQSRTVKLLILALRVNRKSGEFQTSWGYRTGIQAGEAWNGIDLSFGQANGMSAILILFILDLCPVCLPVDRHYYWMIALLDNIAMLIDGFE